MLRMRKSAMLWLNSNRLSVAASAERIACFCFTTSLMIVRLIRAPSSFAFPLLERLGNQPAFRRAHHHKAAIGLRKNIEQAIEHLRQNLIQPVAWLRFCVISTRARNFVSGFTANPHAADAARHVQLPHHRAAVADLGFRFLLTERVGIDRRLIRFARRGDFADETSAPCRKFSVRRRRAADAPPR